MGCSSSCAKRRTSSGWQTAAGAAPKAQAQKRKHTAFAGHCDARTWEKLLGTGRLTNSDIRKALSIWAGDNQNTDQRGESEHG